VLHFRQSKIPVRFADSSAKAVDDLMENGGIYSQYLKYEEVPHLL